MPRCLEQQQQNYDRIISNHPIKVLDKLNLWIGFIYIIVSWYKAAVENQTSFCTIFSDVFVLSKLLLCRFRAITMISLEALPLKGALVWWKRHGNWGTKCGGRGSIAGECTGHREAQGTVFWPQVLLLQTFWSAFSQTTCFFHILGFLCRVLFSLKDFSIPSVPGEVLLENLTEASPYLPPFE